jgi:hypothetical protein
MLKALPYHEKVKEYFKSQGKTWDYFSTAKTKEGQLEQFKNELLKNTYKFDPVADNFIYEKVEVAREKLELQGLPITVYQAQYTDELNAGIVYLHKEAHIVFSGPIVKLLDEEELLAVLAHELAHVKLFSMLEGDLETTDRIISSIANNYGSEASYFETARLFRLYTEIFCDRGSFQVLGKSGPIISSLVKISTGLDRVNADSYLKQADEIFANEQGLKTGGISHPENFVRAKALQCWTEDPLTADEKIAGIIEGTIDIDQLDIFMQQELEKMTLQLLQLFTKPKWMQTQMILSQAKQYFTSFATDNNIILTDQFAEQIKGSHQSVKDYLAYVLLDFALVDPSLEEIPQGWAFQFAEDLFLKETYDSINKKEMKFSDKKLGQHKQKVLSAYYEVKEGEGEQIYEDR